MKQASEVAADHRVRAGGLDGVDLLVGHGFRDRGVLDAERAAEAAADVGPLHLAQLGPARRGEERTGLFADAELAQPGTGIVIGDAARWRAGGFRAPPRHPGKEIDQLVCPAGERGGLAGPFGIVGEEVGKMADEHRAARSRRDDDMLEPVERGHGAARAAPGRLAITAVVGGLAAAALRARHLDPVAGALDQPRRGEAYRGPEQVHQAGREEPDRRALLRRFRHTPAAFSPGTGNNT